MNLTQGKLYVMVNDANEIVKDVLGLEVPKIKYSIGTAKNQAGLADWGENTIRISKEVMKYHSEEECMNTIIHEIFHIVARTGHTGKWKVYANRFNKSKYADRYGDITRLYQVTEEQKEANSKYIIACTSCNEEFHYTKLSKAIKNPSLYICKCKGKLERIK